MTDAVITYTDEETGIVFQYLAENRAEADAFDQWQAENGEASTELVDGEEVIR